MKKFITMILVGLVVLSLSACNDTGTGGTTTPLPEAPVIVLGGVVENPVVPMDQPFNVLEGILVVDNKDTDIEDSLIVTVEPGSIDANNVLVIDGPGDYVLTYTVTDSDGNETIRTRTVSMTYSSMIFSDTFSTSAGKWEQSDGGVYTVAVNEDGELEVDIDTISETADGISLTQSGSTYLQGRTYEVTFEAKSSIARGIQVRVGEVVSDTEFIDFKPEHNGQVYLNTKMATYSIKFVMEESDNSNGGIIFDFGTIDMDVAVGQFTENTEALITIDNVSVREVDLSRTICKGLDGCNEFVEQLLEDLTIEQKIAQMVQTERGALSYGDMQTYGLGSLLSGGGSAPGSNTPDSWYSMIANFQTRALLNEARIPMIYGVDAVHGHNNVQGATLFPHNIGLGAANDADLMYRIGKATAAEMRSTGVSWNFAPTVAIVQDIRWGRTYESFSERLDILNNLTIPYINGLQEYGVSATAKHFIADGATNGGQDRGNAIIDEQTLRDIHLPPYIQAIEAGVDTIMASYSSINGVKMHASYDLLTTLLKEELGFKGFVISDWHAIHELDGTYYDQVTTSINAGVDMLMEPISWVGDQQETTWKDTLNMIQLGYDNGDITEERINDAVRRILTVKHERGLFEYYKYRLDPDVYFRSQEHLDLAREAVRKSLVLLKNDNATLPLSKSANVLLIGPAKNSVSVQSGGWSLGWHGDYGSNWTIKSNIPGTTIQDGFSDMLTANGGTLYTDIADAPNADVVVVAIGERMYVEGFGDNQELTLRSNTTFSGTDVNGVRTYSIDDDNLTALQAAYDTGLPVVVVMISGRPLLIGDEIANWDAFVEAWLPSTEGGSGIADVLFGDFDFQGKLPVTWPANNTQFGYNSNNPSYDENSVQWPYGYGLTYND